MNAEQLDNAREKWFSEKDIYAKYGEYLIKEMERLFSDNNVRVLLSCRLKDDSSLLKKILNKDESYDEITDKVGARGIVNFKNDIGKADELILSFFGNRIKKRDNKIDHIDVATFNYLSIHYDIISDSNEFLIDNKQILCEFQLRTICQNTWADLSHILTYKPGIELPKKIVREVNALCALMEIADTQFQRISDMVNNLTTSPYKVLMFLDDFFYTKIASWYDVGMSHYFFKHIDDLYDSEEDIESILNSFIQKEGDDLSQKSKQIGKNSSLLFYTQPEIIVILERLENKKYLLIDYWQKLYPLDILSDIAHNWGKSLE